MTRYELLLPLYYNDGRPVEPEKFLQTDDELVDRFGGTTTHHITIRGRWVYDSVRYSDHLVRVVIDVESTTENRAFMVQFKETLKERFQQLDIYITAHELEVI